MLVVRAVRLDIFKNVRSDLVLRCRCRDGSCNPSGYFADGGPDAGSVVDRTGQPYLAFALPGIRQDPARVRACYRMSTVRGRMPRDGGDAIGIHTVPLLRRFGCVDAAEQVAPCHSECRGDRRRSVASQCLRDRVELHRTRNPALSSAEPHVCVLDQYVDLQCQSTDAIRRLLHAAGSDRAAKPTRAITRVGAACYRSLVYWCQSRLARSTSATQSLVPGLGTGFHSVLVVRHRNDRAGSQANSRSVPVGSTRGSHRRRNCNSRVGDTGNSIDPQDTACRRRIENELVWLCFAWWHCCRWSWVFVTGPAS